MTLENRQTRPLHEHIAASHGGNADAGRMTGKRTTIAESKQAGCLQEHNKASQLNHTAAGQGRMKLKRTTPAKSKEAGSLLDTLEAYLEPGSIPEQAGSVLKNAAEPDAELDRWVLCACLRLCPRGVGKWHGASRHVDVQKDSFRVNLSSVVWDTCVPAGHYGGRLEPGSFLEQAERVIHKTTAEADAEVDR